MHWCDSPDSLAVASLTVTPPRLFGCPEPNLLRFFVIRFARRASGLFVVHRSTLTRRTPFSFLKRATRRDVPIPFAGKCDVTRSRRPLPGIAPKDSGMARQARSNRRTEPVAERTCSFSHWPSRAIDPGNAALRAKWRLIGPKHPAMTLRGRVSATLAAAHVTSITLPALNPSYDRSIKTSCTPIAGR